MANLLLLLTTFSFFGPPTVNLGKGMKATLYGSGPPVVFSSGLYGSMPKFLYNDLFRKMGKNVTLVKLDRPFVNAEGLEEVVTALGVDKVGFMAHSSFDANVLTSSFLKSAVLCDPIVFPSFSQFSVASPAVDIECPVLNLRAERSYNVVDSPPIPDFLAPVPVDDSQWQSITLQGVGHADILDDAWADMGSRFFPWLNGPLPPSRPFESWSLSNSKEADIKKIRDDYRSQVATLAIEHLLAEKRD